MVGIREVLLGVIGVKGDWRAWMSSISTSGQVWTSSQTFPNVNKKIEIWEWKYSLVLLDKSNKTCMERGS